MIQLLFISMYLAASVMGGAWVGTMQDIHDLRKRVIIGLLWPVVVVSFLTIIFIDWLTESK